MATQRLAGVLWLNAGISSGGIAFFLVDPLDLAIFIGGAVLAVLLALAMLVRPSASSVIWSNLLGAGWLLAFGAVILTRLSLPIAELFSGRLGTRVWPRWRTRGACPSAANSTGLTSTG